jgi:glycosyltransferase involved in cell wall biosynthesis
VYSREITFGLARAHPETRFLYCYRPHRFVRSFTDSLPANARRRILRGAPRADLFHALNQRVDHRARRTVTTFHDLFVMTGDYSSSEFRARFTLQARDAAERSELIIAVSRFTAGQVESLLKVEPSRIRVIPHGAHVPLSSRDLPSRDGVPSGPGADPLVLFVGAIQKRKNIARLVKAFERLPDPWKLVLAGSTDGYGAADELRAVDESPRRASIEVLGYVSAARLESLYARASIFSFPSLDEGFGMPVLDAMAHGVPVITSNGSALPEAAGDAALLVDPTDTDALSEALVRLSSDDALRQDLIHRGLARARELTWESAVEKTWAVYNELL